eukprot:874893_1
MTKITDHSLDISQLIALQTFFEENIGSFVVIEITANGFWYNQYTIRKDATFSIQHLFVLKVYTDYTTASKALCATLRTANPQAITEIAIWCKLLSECVQCYGTPLLDRKTRYYRGINSTFIFASMATKFNLPTSTSRDQGRAVSFVEDNGLLLVLRKYGTSDVFKLDCDKLSLFDYEKETMFFGGNTTLQIWNIQQPIGKWVSYKKYMQPLNIILRMIH